MRFQTYVPTLVVSLLLVVGCGGKQDVVVQKEVQVIDASVRDRLQDFELGPNGSGTLRFAADAPGLAELEPGRILISEPAGNTAPHGFLQRIRSKRTEGGSIVFETEQVTLEEVFERADIVHEVQLKPEQLVSSEVYYPGIQLQPMSTVGPSSLGKSFDFNVTFDKVLIDLDDDESTEDDQLRIDGSFKLSAGVEMGIKIGTEYLVVPTVEQVRFLAKLEEAVELNLTGTLQDSFEKEIQVASFGFGAITVFVGPVPVVFSVNMTLSVGASGEISASLKASASQSVSVQAGAEYTRDGGWKNLSGFDSTFDVPTPELSLSGKARAFARPELAIAVYGIGGPTAAATAFAELDAELYRDPFWQMTGGVDLAVGLKAEIPIIGKEFDWSDEYELFRRTIAAAPNQAPTLEVLSPSDGYRLQEGSPLNFSVRASDREQEELTVTIKRGGEVVATGKSVRGEDIVVEAGTPCPGTYTYEVTVKDGKGATTSKRISVVVENALPTVELDIASFEDMVVIPGGFLFATASASDRSCQASGNSAAQDLIQWQINGQPVGNARELAYVVPANVSPGSFLNVRALYDDGVVVAQSETYAVQVTAWDGTNTPPQVLIDSPTDGAGLLISATWQLIGRARDTQDGNLGPAQVIWHLSTPGYGVTELPFKHYDSKNPEATRLLKLPPAPGVESTLTLTATDSQGASTSKSISIIGTVMQ